MRLGDVNLVLGMGEGLGMGEEGEGGLFACALDPENII